ncbi:MAG: hypothetical protein A2Y15_05985 [Clostridiales bacterium GWF2_36_10]|nr:MAG: hypothetical protein A2Y15_05985 [Clostridiales bacterium GWF2_36_10]HAN21592.1 hypothetical protein [Clostridiales bacterium]
MFLLILVIIVFYVSPYLALQYLGGIYKEGYSMIIIGIYMILIFLFIGIPIITYWLCKRSYKYTKNIWISIFLNSIIGTLAYLFPYIPKMLIGRYDEKFLYGFILFSYIFIISFIFSKIVQKKIIKKENDVIL